MIEGVRVVLGVWLRLCDWLAVLLTVCDDVLDNDGVTVTLTVWELVDEMLCVWEAVRDAL